MIPFLKPKSIVSGIVASRKPDPDGNIKDTGIDGETDSGLMACSEDLIRAVHSKDAKAVAEALQSAFDVLESMPHEEGTEE